MGLRASGASDAVLSGSFHDLASSSHVPRVFCVYSVCARVLLQRRELQAERDAVQSHFSDVEAALRAVHDRLMASEQQRVDLDTVVRELRTQVTAMKLSAVHSERQVMHANAQQLIVDAQRLRASIVHSDKLAVRVCRGRFGIYHLRFSFVHGL